MGQTLATDPGWEWRCFRCMEVGVRAVRSLILISIRLAYNLADIIFYGMEFTFPNLTFVYNPHPTPAEKRIN
jgi:hypothetical protein